MRRLLIRPGAIGDFIVSLPAMEFLRTEYTEIWAATKNLPLARFACRTRSILDTGLERLGLPGVEAPPKLIEELASFDSIISWYGTNRPEFRRATEKLGLPFKFLEALPPDDCKLHAADFYLRQAGGSGQAVPHLPCPPSSRDFIAIHPFSGSPRKNWPLENYIQLTEHLKKLAPVRWILEPGAAAPRGVEVEPPTEDLYELACRLARAKLYIGNDSGITHLAAAAGAPVVALFGPTDPRRWGPRGERVRILSAGSLESIETEQVIAAGKELLL